MNRPARVRTLLFSTLYPSSVRPGHGIFVETRLRDLLASGQVETKVIAPVPWFFSTHPRYGDYARIARTPLRETHNAIDVQHPRYFLPPKVGMNFAPLTLAMGARSSIQGLIDEGFHFDVIDAHYYYPDGVAAALLARHFGKALTITARGSDINLVANFLLPRRWMQWASRQAQASIGVSNALRRAMAEMGFPTERLMVMRNGVDLQRFHLDDAQTARHALRWPQRPTLLCVGNLVENKGQHIAIEALTQLNEFELVIAGEGPQRSALQELAGALGVANRVRFLGQLKQVDLASCYGAADMLLLPSSREGWPNVLLEAMACGTPVVATDVGGVSEIVTTDAVGRLMAERSPVALVAAVRRLWQEMPDRRDVRAHAQQHGWRATTDAQLALFHRLASDSPTGDRKCAT